MSGSQFSEDYLRNTMSDIRKYKYAVIFFRSRVHKVNGLDVVTCLVPDLRLYFNSDDYAAVYLTHDPDSLALVALCSRASRLVIEVNHDQLELAYKEFLPDAKEGMYYLWRVMRIFLKTHHNAALLSLV